jgi:hypothetical protein
VASSRCRCGCCGSDGVVGWRTTGWPIQRHRKRGTYRRYVCTYPSRKALKNVMAMVPAQCRKTGTPIPLDALLISLNRILRGWCVFFRPGVSSAAFQYLSSYAWRQVIRWLRRKHRRITWKELRRRFRGGGWWPAGEDRELFNPVKVRTTRYRYRGATIPTPWPILDEESDRSRSGTCGAPGALKGARRVREAVRGNGPAKRWRSRPGPTSRPETRRSGV